MGYTTTRVCVYKTVLTAEDDPADLVRRVEANGANMRTFNDKVVGVEAFVDAGELVTRMEFRHSDQWLIRRKAPHVAVAILVQSGVDISRTHLADVMKPRDVPPRP